MERYSQIVAELRGRIESGQLAPGDRVPSTREITREWGVAMATATRVLTELRTAGLVRAVPGVGTVVAAVDRPGPASPTGPSAPARRAAAAPPAASRPQPGEPALTPERIVAAAVAVADAEGLAALSMRRVATELGAATMSLYRHVTDKEDLLFRMLDAAFAGHPLPADPPPGWRERLDLAARRLWAAFRRHPWLASAMSLTRPQPVASALPYTEWVLAALEDHGLDGQTVFTAHLVLLNYVRGIALNLELEREAEAQTGQTSEEWMDAQEGELSVLLDPARFPRLAAMASAGYDFQLDRLFEFGLERMLDGLAVLIGEQP
ncbi:TetR/AcrR family transcriptional regulator C-terminal domain-containing protein [Kitasatospora sp. NPDC048365]|uniref:TetR/AcrR family transcriptional regulator C-terminal domain-containing protein n=1 Tax=Kitasatospora sp. NPDC048365 TaxID=3364050 RepID=UPI0037134429